eukprot:TRINITY_DN3738_c0_g3_i9.p1 TRINITY_DN3738_c0_g3~~TRINITY_DN3738_c0_g3_i9.p1  ORF type:complete len:552 (+),score=115.99 TRINITY_DN3738_c0_g3_i9:240-1895(+)
MWAALLTLLSPSTWAPSMVFQQSRGKYTIVGKTETITDNLNPVFVKSVVINYLFEERQPIRFSVYHITDFKETASVEQKLIGSVDMHVHELVTAAECRVEKEIVCGNQKNLGKLVITGEEKKKGSNVMYKIMFEGRGFNSEYLFYRLNRVGAAGNYAPIMESETARKVKEESVHKFTQIEIPKAALIKDDEDKKAMVEVFGWNKSGAHTSLGRKDFTMTDLMESSTLAFTSGTLRALTCTQTQSFSFLDYVLNGLEIALSIAVDFTGSNGYPSCSSSLHYFDMSRNQYLQAITNVGQILENYDSDKKFSVFGFGASMKSVMPNVSHCFALNGNIFAPEIETLQGVIETYKTVLRKLNFSGPTRFSDILKYVNRMIEYESVKMQQSKYYILLLLTDGIIDDMQETIDEIVRASALPLSIIIIGVGTADFSSMEVLDADDEPLYSKKLKKKMERDIVQFVPFAEYKHDPVRLAKETLEEVPRQLLSYMKSKNIPPIREKLQNNNAASFFDWEREQFSDLLRGKGHPRAQIDATINAGIAEATESLFQVRSSQV